MHWALREGCEGKEVGVKGCGLFRESIRVGWSGGGNGAKGRGGWKGTVEVDVRACVHPRSQNLDLWAVRSYMRTTVALMMGP